MTDGTIVALSLTGGAAVLLGYYFIAATGVGSKLYKIFSPNEKSIFLVLSSLSIVSFFYLFYWASFTDSLNSWSRGLYIGSVATYLLGASMWSVAAYKIVKFKQKPDSQIPALAITALGTVGVLIAVAYAENKDGLKYSFAVLAAVLFLVQHAVFDLFYWSRIHRERYKKKSKISVFR